MQVRTLAPDEIVAMMFNMEMQSEPGELEKLLDPDEAVRWSARPDPWRYIRPSFIIYIVGVPWTIFTFGWLSAVTGGFEIPHKVVDPYPWWTPWMAIGVGIILFVAGLWMLSAPFWIWRRGKRTLYAITDRRALVLDTKFPKKMQTLSLTGKVSFRVLQPEETISDLDILCGSSKGLLLRAVKEPRRVIESFQTPTGAPQC